MVILFGVLQFGLQSREVRLERYTVTVEDNLYCEVFIWVSLTYIIYFAKRQSFMTFEARNFKKTILFL